MIRKFSFDYDLENDNLFLFDPKSKSKASIELGDFIIDFNTKKEVTGIELINASKFFKGININETAIDKKLLNEIIECKIEIIPKGNFFIIKFMITFKSKKQLVTPIFVPSIDEKSPALAY